MKGKSRRAEFVGIDVSKARLEVAMRHGDEASGVPNDAGGIAQLAERLGKCQPTLIVLEATGGYELPVAERFGERAYDIAAHALCENGLSVTGPQLRALAAELATSEGQE